MNKILKYSLILIFLFILLAGSLWFSYIYFNGNADGPDYLMDMNNISCQPMNEEYNICYVDRYYMNGTRVKISGLQPRL
jgi:hypothetical protein